MSDKTKKIDPETETELDVLKSIRSNLQNSLVTEMLKKLFRVVLFSNIFFGMMAIVAVVGIWAK